MQGPHGGGKIGLAAFPAGGEAGVPKLSGRDQERVFTVEGKFVHRPAIGGDYRATCVKRLQQREAEALPWGWVQHGRARRVVGFNRSPSKEAGLNVDSIARRQWRIVLLQRSHGTEDQTHIRGFVSDKRERLDRKR